MTIHGTTILAVRKNGQTAVGGDGQVTIENTVMKQGARKVRRLYQDRVIAGFAGAAGDALALFERFESKLEEAAGNLPRARCKATFTSNPAARKAGIVMSVSNVANTRPQASASAMGATNGSSPPQP